MWLKRAVPFLLVILFIGSTLAADTNLGTAIGATIAKSQGIPASPTITTLTQPFGIGTSSICGSSNINCFINAGGSRLSNFTTTWTLAGPLRGTDNIGGNFSFQVNGYSPPGYVPSYMQWVVVCVPGGVGLLYCHVQVMYVQQNDGVLIELIPPSTIDSIADSEMTTGTTIAVSVYMNSTGNVDGTSGTIKTASGVTIFAAQMTIGQFSPATGSTEGTGNAQAPVTGFEAQLIGSGSSEIFGIGQTLFTQAAGSVSYSSVTQLLSLHSPVGLPYVQYNGANKGTIEKSNLDYGAVSTSVTSSSSTSQTVSSSSLSTSKTNSTSQTLISTIIPQIVPYSIKQGQFGEDLGPITYTTSLLGLLVNTSKSDGFRLGLPTVGPTALTASALYHNSTHTAFKFSGGAAITAYTLNIFSKPEGYQDLITLQGTAASSTVIKLPLTGIGGARICDTAPIVIKGIQVYAGCTEACFGNSCFSWADMASFNPSYNNQTHVLTFTVNGAFSIDPLALDGSGTCGGAATTPSCAATFTTASSPDLLYCTIGSEDASTTGLPHIASVDSSPALTWTKRVQQTFLNAGSFGNTLEGWYAIWSSTGSITATITSSVSTGNNYMGVNCFGVRGVNTASPFDANGAIPAKTSNGGSVTSLSLTISTTSANDLLITALGIGQGCIGAQPSGFTELTCPPTVLSTAYSIVSSTQSSVTETWNWACCGGASAGMIFDAVVGLGGPTIVQSTVCTGTGSTGTCAFGSNTASGDTSLVLAFDTVSTAVSSVSDSQSLGYAFIVKEDSGTIGDAEGWMACQTLTAAADTITTHYGISVTWAIILYELSPTDCAPSSSTGTGTAQTSAAVGSYTPINPSLVIGGLASTIGLGFTCAAGTGYTKDQAIAPTTVTTDCAEHITNLGTGETTPWTFVSSSYNEISMAFQTSATMVAITETASATASISPSIQALNVHKVAGTVSITAAVGKAGVKLVAAALSIVPKVANDVVHLVSASVTITPKVGLADLKTIATSVMVTAKVLLANVKQVLTSVTITPSISCLVNGLSCNFTHYVFTLLATVSVHPSVSAFNLHNLIASVTVTAKVVVANVKQIFAGITITPSVSCLVNGLSCSAAHYVFTLLATLSVHPLVSAFNVHNIAASLSVIPSVIESGAKQIGLIVIVVPSLSCLLTGKNCGPSSGGTGPISGCGLVNYPICTPTIVEVGPGVPKVVFNPLIILVGVIATVILIGAVKMNDKKTVPTTTIRKPPVARPGITKKEVKKPKVKRPKLRRLFD
jgi:hypothetical protein